MSKTINKILVTGSSRGIGKAICLSLKEKGYEVLGTSTTKAGVKNLSKIGIKGILLDLNNRESIKNLNKKLIDEHSDIDGLINNAGATRDNIVLRMKEEEWTEVLNIHLTGMFLITKTILKFMLKNKKGRIINISSTSASVGNKGQANYSAAKSGVEAFTRSLAKEVGSRGITVNVVAPGYIDTDMTDVINDKLKKEILNKIPLGRFGAPNEIAQLIEFLISKEASYITGQTIHVNGGLYM